MNIHIYINICVYNCILYTRTDQCVCVCVLEVMEAKTESEDGRRELRNYNELDGWMGLKRR